MLVPARNERDLDDVPKDIRDELKIHLIKRVDEVLPLVLEPPPPSTATPPHAAGAPSAQRLKATPRA